MTHSATPRTRPRLPSTIAKWQLALRIVSFMISCAFVGVLLWSNVSAKLFDVPAYVGVALAYLVDIHEIVALRNHKRTVRRWSTFWIVFIDLMATGWFIAGIGAEVRFGDWYDGRYPEHGTEAQLQAYDTVEAYEERHRYFLVDYPVMIGCLTGLATHALMVLFYSITWLTQCVKRRRGRKAANGLRVAQEGLEPATEKV